jgi:hypothetical protein
MEYCSICGEPLEPDEEIDAVCKKCQDGSPQDQTNM